MPVAEIFTPQPEAWGKIRDRILFLEREAFGDLALTNEVEEDFLKPVNTIALLKDGEKIIGFMYAKPVEEAEPERIREKGETAYLWDIVIDPLYRGKKLTGLISEVFEDELRKRGYQYMEECARVANNFASNVAKHYGERIIKTHPLNSVWGPQVFFRIKL